MNKYVFVFILSIVALVVGLCSFSVAGNLHIFNIIKDGIDNLVYLFNVEFNKFIYGAVIEWNLAKSQIEAN